MEWTWNSRTGGRGFTCCKFKVCCALFGRQQMLRFLIHCLTGITSTSKLNGIHLKFSLYIQYNIYRLQMHYMDGTDLKVARLQINLAMRIKSSFVTDLKVARLQINLAMQINVTSTNIIGLDVPRCFTPFLYKSFNHF